MKNKFLETIKLIENERAENLQKLLNSSYDKLEELKKYYNDRYKNAEELGYIESAIVNQKHYNLIDETIKVKQWCDNQNKITEKK